MSGGLTAFDKRDTDTLITQKHSTVWWFLFVTSDTDIIIIGQGHFPTCSVGNQSCCWLTEIFPVVHIFPPLSQRSVRVEVCVPLKDSSTKCPAASIQHSLIQKLKGIQKLYSQREPTELLAENKTCRYKKRKKKKTNVAPFHHFCFVFVSASDLHERMRPPRLNNTFPC